MSRTLGVRAAVVATMSWRLELSAFEQPLLRVARGERCALTLKSRTLGVRAAVVCQDPGPLAGAQVGSRALGARAAVVAVSATMWTLMTCCLELSAFEQPLLRSSPRMLSVPGQRLELLAFEQPLLPNVCRLRIGSRCAESV